MIDNVLTYKGYSTRVEYSVEDAVLHGKIEGIADLVNFESETVKGVENAFHEAVDDYLAFCEDLGKSPDKEYRGTFNVRVTPGLHRKLDLEARKKGISMNQYIEQALERQLKEEFNRTDSGYQVIDLERPGNAEKEAQKIWDNVVPMPQRGTAWNNTKGASAYQ